MPEAKRGIGRVVVGNGDAQARRPRRVADRQPGRAARTYRIAANRPRRDAGPLTRRLATAMYDGTTSLVEDGTIPTTISAFETTLVITRGTCSSTTLRDPATNAVLVLHV